jgi:hypothetical protein
VPSLMAWVAIWDGDAELVGRAGRALRSMTSVHPDLDPATWVEVEEPGRGWAAVMTRPPREDRAEQEVAVQDGSVAIVDGLAVTARESLLGPRDLLGDAPFDPSSVEGQFVALRCGHDELEVHNDAFGLRHVYWWQRGSTYVFANSVEVIARTVGGALDLDAVSLFLTLGWPAGDATLCTDVRQLPGGRSWRFDNGQKALGSHFELTSLYGRRTWRYDPYPLADALEAQLRVVAANREHGLHVAMSGGMDSRLMAALVSHSGAPASYYSVGHPDSFDARTAARLARRLGAQHDMYPQTIDDIAGAWGTAVGRYVAANDGLASVWLMGDTIGTEGIAERDAVILQGVAGELARWYAWPRKLLLRPTRARVLGYLTRRVDDVGLASGAARARAVDYVTEAFADAAAQGCSERDTLMVWYATERARRWGGANNRKISNVNDVFTPFTTRSFVEASFRLHWARGYGEPIHHDLVKRLSPPLYAERPEMGRWPVQVPYANMAVQVYRDRRRTTLAAPRSTATYQQDLWPERLRSEFLDRYLDLTTSDVWDVVDRHRFEQLLTDEDGSARRRAAATILEVVTVLEYDRVRRAAPRP